MIINCRKLLVAIFLCLMSFSGSGSYYFRSYIEADNTYKISTRIIGATTMNIAVSREATPERKSRGLKKSIVLNTEQLIDETVTTGKMASDSSFFVRSTVNKFNMVTKINGVENNPLKGDRMTDLEITGLGTKDHKITNVRVEGGRLSEEFRSALAASVENMSSSINYPDTPIAIGDTFQQNMPMTIPVPGYEPAQIEIVINYKLVRVDADTAYFDNDYKMVMGQDNEGYDMSVDGSGTGEVAHDLRKNYFIKSISNWQMTATIETDKMQMTLHTRMLTETTCR